MEEIKVKTRYDAVGFFTSRWPTALLGLEEAPLPGSI
jgi:hypothetical protein